MQSLDAELIRRSLKKAGNARLEELEVFAEIDSTNAYLMRENGPAPGELRVAVTDNQTAGRGRHGRSWQSPKGSGLCLSVAFRFASLPRNLPALTLATGLAVIESLNNLDIQGVSLKWPNDLVAKDGKLGGILTEAQTQRGSTVVVVTGVGLNIDLGAHADLVVETDWARRIVDLQSCVATLPDRNVLTAMLIGSLGETFVHYERAGFPPFHRRWPAHDWLLGRAVTTSAAASPVIGIAAGVAEDGALLIDTVTDGRQRITSGSVLLASVDGEVA